MTTIKWTRRNASVAAISVGFVSAGLIAGGFSICDARLAQSENDKIAEGIAAKGATAAVKEPAESTEKESALTAEDKNDKPASQLKDGFYLIIKEAETRDALPSLSEKETVLINDYEFLDPSEREKPSFIVVSSESFVPFIFSNAPAKDRDEKGRTKLLLELADDQVKHLEQFTETNNGKSVAIVVGGKVVTTHKIREPIREGKLQITRCSDFGCDVLFTQLQQKR